MDLYDFTYMGKKTHYCTDISTSHPTPFHIYSAESFGWAVRHLLEQGVTQAGLAARLDIRRPTLAGIEAGEMTTQPRRPIEGFEVLGVRITIQTADW